MHFRQQGHAHRASYEQLSATAHNFDVRGEYLLFGSCGFISVANIFLCMHRDRYSCDATPCVSRPNLNVSLPNLCLSLPNLCAPRPNFTHLPPIIAHLLEHLLNLPNLLYSNSGAVIVLADYVAD